MSLKDWPPFGANRQTYREWREEVERTKKEENDAAWSQARWSLLVIVAILLLNAMWGCAPIESKVAQHWDCVQATGSYVQCKHLEVIQ